MKRISKILSILLMATLFLTGCAMKSNYNIEISSDKNVTISYILAYDDELIDALIESNSQDEEEEEPKEVVVNPDEEDEEEVTDEETEESTDEGEMQEPAKHTESERWEYLENSVKEGNKKNKNVKIEKYNEVGFKGYTYTLETVKIDDVTKDSKEKFNLAGEFDQLKGNAMFTKKGNNYVSNITLNNTDSTEEQYQTQLGENFEAKLIVTLPNKVISTNATEVSKDGKTLTWDLTKNVKDIDFEFSFGGFPILLVGIAALVLVVIVVVVLLIVTKKKPKDKNENPVPTAPVENTPQVTETPSEPVTEAVPTEPVTEVNTEVAQPAGNIDIPPVEPLPPVPPVENTTFDINQTPENK